MQNNTECKLQLKKKKKKEAGKGSEAVKTLYPVTPVWDTEASSHKRILGARVRTHSSVPLRGWLSWDMYTLTLLVTVWRLFLRTKSRFWWPKSTTDYKMQCLACDLNMYEVPGNYYLAATLRVGHRYINFADEENSDSKNGLSELNFL